MSFFDKLYRMKNTRTEYFECNLPEPRFRFGDLLGGLIVGRCTLADRKLPSGSTRGITKEALSLALYYLVANGYLTMRIEHFRRTLFGSIDMNTERLILQRNEDSVLNEELESPLLAAIYAAVDGKRRLKTVVGRVLNGYLGANVKHDKPLTVFFASLLHGEMRNWRLERETTNWGFRKHYAFSCPEEHFELLMEAGQEGRQVLSKVSFIEPKFNSILGVWTETFLLKVAMRKRKHHREHHYPRRPHRKLPRRRKPQEPDDPGMWNDAYGQ